MRAPTAITELRLARLQAGLRILDVTARTGLSTTRVSEIERDVGRPASPEELELLRSVIGAEVASS